MGERGIDAGVGEIVKAIHLHHVKSTFGRPSMPMCPVNRERAISPTAFNVQNLSTHPFTFGKWLRLDRAAFACVCAFRDVAECHRGIGAGYSCALHCHCASIRFDFGCNIVCCVCDRAWKMGIE